MSYKEEALKFINEIGIRNKQQLVQIPSRDIDGYLLSELLSDFAEKKVKESQSNLLDQKIDEELKRLKKEQRKLVNSVGKWSALAIDRKQDLDEANKKIEELKEALQETCSELSGQGVPIPDKIISLTK